jgi:asparagine synthase (glutamine-hydrolysing)
MSTVFGIFRPNGGDIPPEHVRAMQDAMNHWHADDSGIHLRENLMLGHLMLYNTPESFGERNPFSYDTCIITADARLYNRGELLNLLQTVRPLPPETPDSELILHLYRQMGVRCVERMIGDFAFAIWDSEKQELFCARDQLGIRPFFHYHRNGIFLFASEKKGILAHPGTDTSIDEDFIKRLAGDMPPDPSSTFHAHVKHLPPGHHMRVGRSGIVTERYWQLSIPPTLKLRSPSEYEEAFREQLTIAVSCRLRTAFPVGAELSGGLDSSLVTALAAAGIGDPDRLHTFSNVLPRDAQGRKDAVDEEQFIDDMIRHCGLRHPVKVTQSDRKDLFGPLDLDILVNGGVDIISSFWLEPFRRRMQEMDIRVCLSGFFGDEMTTNPGRNYHFDLPAEGKYLDFIKASWQKGQYALPLKTLLRHLLPDALIEKISGKSHLPAMRRSFLIDAADEALAAGEDHARRMVGQPYSHKRHLTALSSNIYSLRRMQIESLYGIMHRVEPRYPLADIRLLEFFLSLPASEIGHPRIERYMYRRSLRDIVPGSVLHRTDKDVPAGVFYVNEARQWAPSFLSWVEELATEKNSGIPEWIDLSKVTGGLDPRNPANNWKGSFYPGIPFGMLCLLRYFSQQDRPVNLSGR